MATDEQWRLVEWDQLANSACTLELRDRIAALESLNCVSAILKLSRRVDDLEAAQNLRQQDEDVEMVAGDPQPIATDEELAACSANAAKVAILERRDYDKALTSADITKVQSRAIYDLGRKHGAAANSKPTSSFAQIRSSADTGLLPMIVSETGSDDEAETERIICSAISGGADYINGMPRELSLERICDGDSISARYVQAPLEVAMPTPAPAAPTGGLVEMLADVWSEGKPLHPAARRAAIRKVASWLEQQQEVPIGSTASADYFAAMLRSEANR